MHVLGKVMLGIAFCLGVAAVLLTSKLINVRNSWMSQVKQAEQSISGLEEQVAKQERAVRDLETKFARFQLNWSDPHISPATNVEQPTGLVTAQLGQDQGFGVGTGRGGPNPTYEAFAVGADGSSEYIGKFELVVANASVSRFRPTFTALPEEIQSWPQGEWRFWQTTPYAPPARVDKLRDRIAERADDNRALQEQVAQAEVEVAQANDHLDYLEKRLTGNPGAQRIERTPEFADGLIATIFAEEEARDSAAEQLAGLRLSVHNAYNQLLAIIEENRDLTTQLPQPVEASRIAERIN
ncbi:hypothetical protein [Stratiformator vulcanicus]|uniref:Protein SlyX n=1 Tax=Stratiformator vulcanicus TaxID=2527980 RepID=A0A517R1W0_9PLAN|nr:hypothetical protein [Stratiformator vulcanicus]QDT37841.1 Protein SlyX [Stratiformator vulcanicus]